MTSSAKRIRVVIAKPGLDGHDTGAKVVAHALKDAGMEVIYTGLHRSIEDIVKTALEENADVIGMSIYSGAHLPLSKKLMDQLEDKGISDKLVLIGGNIPQRDIKILKDYGVAGVFPTGTKLEEIVTFIRQNVKD
ncbi:MAG TPA: cobalamin B12-binding domain-containing protein [Candidatus Heimdallarchaeota archaeon]|nr:cobalamin B12-binding domain-containing protein [Candidatus Heimdallarchaeota archaeon]